MKSYTEDIIGITFDRDDFLKTLITIPLHIAMVAVSNNGDVVGFAIIREVFDFDEDCYRVGPLLADSGDIGRLLLLELANKADVSKKFGIHLCDETNPDASKMKCELGASKYFTLASAHVYRRRGANEEREVFWFDFTRSSGLGICYIFFYIHIILYSILTTTISCHYVATHLG